MSEVYFYIYLQCFMTSNVLIKIMMYEDSLVMTVRSALLDPLPEVRKAAADAFDKLHDTIAQKALDGILPFVLQKLVSL